MNAEALRILVVDDNRADQVIISESLREALEQRPDIQITDTLGSTVEFLSKNPDLDVIFLDLTLPDSIGLNSVVRVHECATTVPIVVLTGMNDNELENQVMHAGAQDYLVKGAINGELIGRVIDHAIERQHMMSHLEEFDRLKSEFLSTASHEMRTPLTVLRENASMLADGVCGAVNDDQLECLDAILRHCDRLGSLLNDLLDLQKIEAGGIHLCRTKAEPLVILRHLVADYQQSCRAKEQTLILEIPDFLPAILADEDQITQALINLIGNAQKFTPAGGTITMKAVVHNDCLVVMSVKDTGMSICKEDMESIFLAFRQSERRDGPGARGTGLGLTITRKIVEMHDGAVFVESDYGKGSCFTFTIPVWSETAELNALLKDRLDEAVSKNAPCTLLMIRCKVGDGDQTLANIAKGATRIFRGCDTGMLLTDLDIALYVLETDEPGAYAAARRLAKEDGIRMSGLDIVIRSFSDVPQTLSNILANSFTWQMMSLMS